ncbi:MAG: NmrA family NAD(P)-binding protein [Bdellovibrionota bacterium]
MKIIAVAGSSGEQGLKVVRELSRLGVKVRALIRNPLAADIAADFKKLNVEIIEVNFNNRDSLLKACSGVECMVSNLSGDRDVIMKVQVELLNACIAAGVKRFIPSAFAIDFNTVPVDKNRNLAILREFDHVLETAHIKSTTILTGAFADMLTGQAPFILFGLKKVIYFSNPDQKMDFTTRDNVAIYTAHAALDETTPRYLRISGDQVSARDLSAIMTKIEGKKFKLLKLGSISGLEIVIMVFKRMSGGNGGKYPIWQGFQYMHNMFAGLGKFTELDNHRYQGIQWTPLESILRSHFNPSGKNAIRKTRS